MFYLVKTPWWLRKMYDNYTWKINTQGEKTIYLSFDDGPHPIITPFVLDQLKSFEARATFFCIGKNVNLYPEVYRRILDEEHSVGNHTYNHLNGWKTEDELYLADVHKAFKLIDSKLFRPPYGRIKSFQARKLQYVMNGIKPVIVMWDVLSGDFDTSISAETCVANVLLHAGPGSIIVFHDSEKAFPRLENALPVILKFYAEKGYKFLSIQP